MAFQNLQLSDSDSDEDLQSDWYPLQERKAPLPVESMCPMREGEAPLPVESMWSEDVSLLVNFITSYRDQISLPTNELFQPETKRYKKLAFLLFMLKGHPVKDLIDFGDRTFTDKMTVIEFVRWLKARDFGGPWFDSLEALLVDNIKYNVDHRRKLKAESAELGSSIREVGTCRLLKSFKGDLASEEAQILSQRENSLRSELADVMEKRKALAVARKSLEFFYYVHFQEDADS